MDQKFLRLTNAFLLSTSLVSIALGTSSLHIPYEIPLVSIGLGLGYAGILFTLFRMTDCSFKLFSKWALTVGFLLIASIESIRNDFGKTYIVSNIPNLPTEFFTAVFLILSLTGLLFLIKNPISTPVYFSQRNSYVFVLLILIISVGAIFFNLSHRQFLNDEFSTMESATGLKNDGTFWKWDWMQNSSGRLTDCKVEDAYCDYTRAEFHSILIAGSYGLFGISEFSTRLPSALAGLVFILLFLTLSLKTRDFRFRAILLLSSSAIALAPSLLFIFRYARMYAILLPFFVALSLVTFKLIIDWESLTYRMRALFSVVALLLFSVCYHLHSQILLFIPSITFFIIFKLIKQGDYKSLKRLLSIVCIGTCIGLAVWTQLSSYESAISFIKPGSRVNFEYIPLLFQYPFGYAGLLCASVLFLYFLVSQYSRGRAFYVFLGFITFTPLLCLIFLIDRFPHIVYISNLIPFAILMAITGFIYFSEKIFAKGLRWIAYSMTLLVCVMSFYSNFNFIYEDENFYYADYISGFKPILENYVTGQAIFLGYSRSYYLKDLAGKAVPEHFFGNKDYSEETEVLFKRKLQEYSEGYITWDDFAAGDIKPSTREYIQSHFKQLSGRGINNTGVEVYFYDSSMF